MDCTILWGLLLWSNSNYFFFFFLRKPVHCVTKCDRSNNAAYLVTFIVQTLIKSSREKKRTCVCTGAIIRSGFRTIKVAIWVEPAWTLCSTWWKSWHSNRNVTLTIKCFHVSWKVMEYLWPCGRVADNLSDESWRWCSFLLFSPPPPDVRYPPCTSIGGISQNDTSLCNFF